MARPPEKKKASGDEPGGPASRPEAESRRRGRPRRQVLTIEGITQAAIALADSEGLEAVSIRRIAAELDARPMSLYDHIENKDQLLASMANSAVAEILVPGPLPEGWRRAVATIARRMYVTFLRHGWLLPVLSQRPRFGSNAALLASQQAESLRELGLANEEIWTPLGTVNDYVLGHSMRVVGVPVPDLGAVLAESDLAESPELAALPESLRTRSSVERFEAGLQIQLDGIERRYQRSDPERGADPT